MVLKEKINFTIDKIGHKSIYFCDIPPTKSKTTESLDLAARDKHTDDWHMTFSTLGGKAERMGLLIRRSLSKSVSEKSNSSQD